MAFEDVIHINQIGAVHKLRLIFRLRPGLWQFHAKENFVIDGGV